jgi:hypothetical protein
MTTVRDGVTAFSGSGQTYLTWEPNNFQALGSRRCRLPGTDV